MKNWTFFSLWLNQRGSTTVGWVGVAFVVVMMVIGIWLALYGPGGQGLKAMVEMQIFRFAAGFEAN